MRVLLSALLSALLASCSISATEIIITVEADSDVAAMIDGVRIEAQRPMSPRAPRTAEADLSTQPLPRSLTLAHAGGALGPVDVRVLGLRGGAELVTRELSVSFREGESLRLVVLLSASCISVGCGPGTTCAEGACRTTEIDPCEFEGGECQDAGADTTPGGDGSTDGCGAVEICNALDDDCDSMIDEDFDLMRDPIHCGRCDRTCETAGDHVSRGSCNRGSCELVCDPGWGDCNRDPADGCEVDLETDMNHCGGCGAFCPPGGTFRAVDTVCTAGRCILSCEPDWGSCDMDTSTGCETHLTVDPEHCGACMSPCPTGLRCRDSVCE